MSAKKSFDVRRSTRKKKTNVPTPRRRSSSRKPLKRRRQEARSRTLLLWGIGSIVVIALALYLLWRPEVRIETIEANGAADPASVIAIAQRELSGTYGGVIPKDSFFFYPERTIRAAILEEHPAVSAVSVSRLSFTSILLEASPRIQAFLWCGVPADGGAQDEVCYEADAEGYVFAFATDLSTSTLRLYAPLSDAHTAELYPLTARVLGTESVPDILRFVRAIESLGVPVQSIGIRGDEADLFVPHGTRITYIIGQEETAGEDASAAFSSLNLMDGSLEYVDLRFLGKVYLKRRGE